LIGFAGKCRLDFEISNLQQQIAEKHKMLEASGDTTSNVVQVCYFDLL
jgi:hypothetical protein